MTHLNTTKIYACSYTDNFWFQNHKDHSMQVHLMINTQKFSHTKVLQFQNILPTLHVR